MEEYKYFVSIIIPCFNAEKTIIRTLNSIANQTINGYQVIIVDDGSTDNTEKIVMNYIKGKNNFLYIKQLNKGVSMARNNGIINAEGRYISFLDADDIYHPQYLELLCREMERKNVDIACSQYRWIGEKEILSSVDKQCFMNELSNREILERYMKKRKYKFSFAGCLYKHQIIADEKIRFDKELNYGEDSLFIGMYLANCKNGGIFIDKELYGYTRNVNSVMHKEVTWKNIDNIVAMEKTVDYWTEKRLDIDFADYMISRAICGIAKDFSRNKELFDKLMKVYDVKHAMKVMSRECKEMSVCILSIIFLINIKLYRKILFYYKRGM